MAQIMYVNVVGGDVKAGKYLFINGILKENKIFKPFKMDLKNNIASLEKVNEEAAKKFLGSIGMGIVGGVLLGGIGALAGVLSGGNKKEISFICLLRDGRKFLATANLKVHNELLSLEIKVNNSSRNDIKYVNFYEILGITFNASDDEIKNAISLAELIGLTESNVLAAAKRALLNPQIKTKYDERLIFGSNSQNTFVQQGSNDSLEKHRSNVGGAIGRAKNEFVMLLLTVGIIFAPYIFSWFTLQKGFSNKVRVCSMIWMFFVVMFLLRSQNG